MKSMFFNGFISRHRRPRLLILPPLLSVLYLLLQELKRFTKTMIVFVSIFCMYMYVGI